MSRKFKLRRKTWQKTYGVTSNPLNCYPSGLPHNSPWYKITPQPCRRSKREQACYHVPSCHTTLAQTTSRGVTLSQLIISRTADRSEEVCVCTRVRHWMSASSPYSTTLLPTGVNTAACWWMDTTWPPALPPLLHDALRHSKPKFTYSLFGN